MFISKKSHETQVKRLEDSHLSDVCHFEARIADLKSQIEDLKRLIFIPKAEPDPVHMEADAIISGSDKPIEMSEKDYNEMLRGVREADMLLSGNYSEDLLQ